MANKITYVLLLLICINGYGQTFSRDFNSLVWGASNRAPVKVVSSRFLSSNQYKIVYTVQDICGAPLITLTTVANFVGDVPVATNFGNQIVNTNGIYHRYFGADFQVRSFTSNFHYPSTISMHTYRGWTYTNVLVVAMDWVATVVDETSTGSVFRLGTNGTYTTESVEAAQLATNLWPGAQMLVISSNCLALQWDTWAYVYTAPEARYAFARVWPYDAVDFREYFIKPITNYLAAHPEIHVIALSYGTPERGSYVQDNWAYGGAEPTILSFYKYSDYGSPYTASNFWDIYYVATNMQVFSFSCRTFADTTNLLVRSSRFNVWHEDTGYIIHDAYGGLNYSGWVLPFSNADLLTNYWDGNPLILRNSTTAGVTATNLPTIMNFNWGWYSGNEYPDNFKRTKAACLPLPNSIASSVESYNFASMYTNPDSDSTKTHQTRNYDYFSPTANFGTSLPTNIPLYSRTFGCSVGATREPMYSGVFFIDYFYPLMVKGYSFVECYYILNNGNSAQNIDEGQLICGHPFMRITDLNVEDTITWDEAGTRP